MSLCPQVKEALGTLFLAFVSSTYRPFATFPPLGSFSRSQGISSAQYCSFPRPGLGWAVSWPFELLRSRSQGRPIGSWRYPTHTSMTRWLCCWNRRQSEPSGLRGGFESAQLLGLMLSGGLSTHLARFDRSDSWMRRRSLLSLATH